MTLILRRTDAPTVADLGAVGPCRVSLCEIAEAARLCGVAESAIAWAIHEGRLATLSDGRIGGLALLVFFKYRRFTGGV